MLSSARKTLGAPFKPSVGLSGKDPKFPRWKRGALAPRTSASLKRAFRPGVLYGLALALIVILTTAAAAPTARFDKLGHRIMCICSCNELLLECNHVGCPNSDGMRRELMAGIDRGDNDSLIFRSFVEKYGPTVLAAPPGTGFNIVGWVMPFAVLLLGIGATALLIRRWRLRTVPMPPPSSTPRFAGIRERIRRETEL